MKEKELLCDLFEVWQNENNEEYEAYTDELEGFADFLYKIAQDVRTLKGGVLNG